MEGLSLRNEFSYQIGLQNNIAFQYEANIGTRSLQAQLYDSRNNSYYYAVRNYLNYNKDLRKAQAWLSPAVMRPSTHTGSRWVARRSTCRIISLT